MHHPSATSSNELSYYPHSHTLTKYRTTSNQPERLRISFGGSAIERIPPWTGPTAAGLVAEPPFDRPPLGPWIGAGSSNLQSPVAAYSESCHVPRSSVPSGPAPPARSPPAIRSPSPVALCPLGPSAVPGWRGPVASPGQRNLFWGQSIHSLSAMGTGFKDNSRRSVISDLFKSSTCSSSDSSSGLGLQDILLADCLLPDTGIMHKPKWDSGELYGIRLIAAPHLRSHRCRSPLWFYS